MGRGTEKDPIGIHQQDITVGPQGAEDLCGVLVKDPVQGRGSRTWLIELDQFMLGDVEAAPVNGDILGVLGDQCGIGVRSTDVAAAGDDSSALGCGEDCPGLESKQQTGGEAGPAKITRQRLELWYLQRMLRQPG